MPKIGTPVRLAIILLTSVLPGVAIPAQAQDAAIVRSSPRDPYADSIAEAAQRFELPSIWIRAVLRAESKGDPRAISSKGAMGLMQIMPETWADLRVRHHLGTDPYDPHDNIIAGAAYIRQLFDRYGSPGWIAAYNAGPGRYAAALKGRPLPSETRAYIAAVAPHLDGAGDPGVAVVATADPLSWTHAPLFVTRPDRDDAAEPVRQDSKERDAATTVVANDAPTPSFLSGALFVRRSPSREGR